MLLSLLLVFDLEKHKLDLSLSQHKNININNQTHSVSNNIENKAKDLYYEHQTLHFDLMSLV